MAAREEEGEREKKQQYEYFIVVGAQWILFGLPSATHIPAKNK